MYKKIISVIILIIMLTVFVSCGKKENVPQEDATPEPDNTDTISLKVVFNETGKSIIKYGGGTNDGYYDVVQRIWNLEEQISSGEFDNNIVYIDYSTKKLVYLCSDPSCRHNTEDCPSYIKSSAGAIVFPVHNRLVCLRLGRSDGFAEKNEDLYAVILMESDGSNRTIYTLDAGESFPQPFIIISDGKRLFLQVISVNDQKTEKRIVSLDMDTLESRVETIIPMTYRLVSAYKEYMLFYDMGEMKNIVFSLSDKSFTESLSSVSGMYKDNMSIDIKYDVEISDFSSIAKAKSVMVLVSDLQKETITEYGPFDLEDNHGGVTVDDFYDDHVSINYYSHLNTNEEHVNYILDFSTGECIKKELLMYRNGWYDPVAIIANAGDSYLVINETVHAVQTFYDRQGVAHTVENNAYPKYALIKKDDYYSNIPNYEVIKDTLCDMN